MRIKVVVDHRNTWMSGECLTVEVLYNEEYFEALLVVRNGREIVAQFKKWDYYMIYP